VPRRLAEDHEIGDQLKQYMDANPLTRADLEGIRRQLTDFGGSVSTTISGSGRSEAVFVGRENPARHFVRVLHCGPA
jgi:hypothetical protein